MASVVLVEKVFLSAAVMTVGMELTVHLRLKRTAKMAKTMTKVKVPSNDY